MPTPDALIIGGSVAGLLAAKALADAGQRALILDRDALPVHAEPRKAVPQGTQVHALLDAGRGAIEALLPGIFDALLADGGQVVDFGAMRWFHAGHLKVVCETPHRMHVQTRPLLEHHIRQRVSESEGVTLRTGARVEGLLVEEGRVAGVRLEGGELLRAPRVVLATGRGATAAKWLEAAGFAPPPVREILLGVGYVTRFYSLPEGWPADRPTLLIYGDRAKTTRHGLAFRVEGDRLQVTLMGYGGDHPPTDAAGMLAWARTLPHPELAELMEKSAPLGEARRFTCPKQHRYDLHRVALPEGLAVLGDAACGLDPVFGQGMSVAALQAQALGAQVAAGRFTTKAFQRAAAAITDRAWLITSFEAQRYPAGAACPDALPGAALVHAYLDRIYAAAAYDAEVHRAFLRVMNLQASVVTLFHPRILWRTLGRRAPSAEAPALTAAEHAPA